MSPDFLQDAALARERYLALLRGHVAKVSMEPNFATELLVRPDARHNAPPFCLHRLDAIFGDPLRPAVHRVADSFEPPWNRIYQTDDGVELRVDDFSWEALAISFARGGFELALLEPWLTNWIDPDDTRPPDSHGLAGVVHDLAWTTSPDGAFRLAIDLGSAPLAALEQLLGVLRPFVGRGISVSRHDQESE